MKRLREWIWPVAVLLVVVSWTAWRSQSTAEVRRKTEVLEERVGEALDDERNDNRLSRTSSQAEGRSFGEDREGIEWAGIVARVKNGSSAQEVLSELRIQLFEMDGRALLTALERIESLDLPSQMRGHFRREIVRTLAEKAPKLALERCFDGSDDGDVTLNWHLASALRNWAAEEPAAAMAWFEERIAGGDFDVKSLDGSNSRRLRFEAALISSLVGSRQEAASERLARLPADLRTKVFAQGMFREVSPAKREALGDLMREHVPPEDRAEAVFSMISMVAHQSGYGTVSSFMDDLGAPEEDRRVVARRIARSQLGNGFVQSGVDREDVDKARDWLDREAPGEGDRILGEMFGSHSVRGAEKLEFGEPGTEVFAKFRSLVEDLHADGAGDDLLVGFLSGGRAKRHPDEARRMADLIEDHARRREVLKFLGGGN